MLYSLSKKVVRLTAVAVAEGSQATADNHEAAADEDGRLAAVVIANVRGDEERDDGTDVEHVDEDSKLVVVCNLGAEERIPLVHLLGGVHEHAVVACGGRGNHEHERHGIQLAQMRLLGPVDLLEARGLSLGNLDLGRDRRDTDVGRHCVCLVGMTLVCCLVVLRVSAETMKALPWYVKEMWSKG